jgi:internalin A
VLAGPVSRLWRRYLRFSVRGLIFFVLVIGAVLGWVVHEARVQRDAVAAIEKAGGWVSYDWGRDGKSIPGGQPWAPRWLVDLIGIHYFGQVTAVGLASSSTADATLAQVGRLTGLRFLTLPGSNVTDAGLMHLKRLDKLSQLDLVGTHVTDAGLVHLKQLTKLSRLDLRDTQVSDAGLAHLTGLTKLTRVYLFGAKVTDSGVNELKRALPGLVVAH